MQSPRSETFFTMPKTMDTKQVNNSKTGRRWFVPGLIAVFFVLLLVVVAAIVLFNQRESIIAKKIAAGDSDKQKESPAPLLEKSNIFRAKIPPGSISLADSPQNKTRLAKNQMKSTVPAGNVKELPAKARSTIPNVTVNQQNSKPISTVRSSLQPETAPASKKPLQKRPTSKESAVSKKQVAARSVPSGKPSTKAKKPDRTREYDRIKDSKLKLQALAWFNDASKRMAVINSHVVREGGSVDGYQVTQIRRQDVVVNDGKKSWRLEFGLKQ